MRYPCRFMGHRVKSFCFSNCPFALIEIHELKNIKAKYAHVFCSITEINWGIDA